MSNELRELMLSFNIIGYICGGFVLVGGLTATEIFIQLGQLSESDRKFMRVAQLTRFFRAVDYLVDAHAQSGTVAQSSIIGFLLN